MTKKLKKSRFRKVLKVVNKKHYSGAKFLNNSTKIKKTGR